MEINPSSSGEMRDQFMQLLVTQLRHQDPLEPIKQQDFLSQLAQFSTLEGIENVSANLQQQMSLQEDVLFSQRFGQAATLVGQNVTYLAADGDQQQVRHGEVDSVTFSPNEVLLQVNGESVRLEQIAQLHGSSSTEE